MKRRRKGSDGPIKKKKEESIDDFLSSLRKEKRVSNPYPAYEYSYKISDTFAPLLAGPRGTKQGTLGSQDYLEGYESEDGENFRREIERYKTPDIDKLNERGPTKTSRSGKEIYEGEEQKFKYHGRSVRYRVDFTKTTSSDESKTVTYDPHARLFVGTKDLSTTDLADAARMIGDSGKVGEKRKQSFVDGFTGKLDVVGEKTMQHKIGVQMRAIGKFSDVFGDDKPLLHSYTMSLPKTPSQVGNLFYNQNFGTGGLGHQNKGASATSEFNAFKEIAGGNKSTHVTKQGTNIDTVPAVRKISAMNHSVPGLVEFEKRQK